MARLLPFFLATPAAFFRRLRLIDFLMDSTRSLGVSQGPLPGSSEKGNSCANSWVLTLLYTLGCLDQLREPRLQGPCLKIIVARGRGIRGAHATGRGPIRLADFFGPMA